MQKYDDLRSEIRNGDIILFRGTSLTAKLIMLFDKAYYSHIGLVFESNDRLFMIDSNSKGVSPKFLSDVMSESTDFCILRPSAWSDIQIKEALGKVLDRAEKKIAYDFSLMPQILLYRLFGYVTDFNKKHKDICSEFVRRFTRNLFSPETSCFEPSELPTNFITPWDFVLFHSNKFALLHDESNRKKSRTN